MIDIKHLIFINIRFIIKFIYFFKDRFEYYTKSIFKKRTTVLFPKKSTKNQLTLAIFAIYQPKGLGFTIKRSVCYLFNNGIKIIVVAPHALNQMDIEFLYSKQCIILIRANFGRDFGSYQCGFSYILNNLYLLNTIDKILFINDSILFPIKENDNNLLEILNLPYDAVGITENYQHNWHICSYFILLRKEIFLHNEIKKFWGNYKPYSSRFHAIYKGEILLGKAIQTINCSYKVIYDGKKLLEVLSRNMHCKSFYEFHDLIHQNVSYKNNIRLLEKIDLEKNICLKKISHLIESHSVMHIFSLALIEYLNCFIMKKDICYRGYFALSYIMQYLSSINNNVNFLDAFANELKEKGLPSSMNFFTKLLYISGAI
jgi:hypothetical protein